MISTAVFGDVDAARAFVAAAAARTPFVADRLARAGLSPDELAADPEAWTRVPMVTKEDVLGDQREAPPFGRRLAVERNELSLVVESSGTSGLGKEVHYMAADDERAVAAGWARYLAGMGTGADDVVALAFPIGMAGGGVRHWQAYSRLGATVLRVGGLSSEGKLEAMRRYGATMLVATPAYVDRLGVLAQAGGVRPAELGLRRIVVATQSVSVEWIAATEELWGARLHEWYGTSAGIAAFSCSEGMAGRDGERGTLHWDPALLVCEILDPETGAPVGDGERGEVVGTPLLNRAEPLFRLRTGDEARFRAPGGCACGSPWPGIESGTVRRLDAMFKIKGINVWPAQIEAVVLGREDVRDYRARIWQDEARRERVGLELLVRAGAGGDACAAVAAALHERTGLTFEVAAIGDPGAWSQELAGEAGKARRWTDERGAPPAVKGAA